MKEPTKAALLSLFGFPGLGHFYLKRYKTGVAISTVVCAALYILVSFAYQRAQAIVDKIVNGTIPLDMPTILALIREAPSNADANLLTIAKYAFLLAWLFAGYHAYRVAKVASPVNDA